MPREVSGEFLESLEMRPAHRSTTADRVYELLERMVIAGQLRPRDRLTELNLAAQLQVSRTPLRQALQQLVNKGWIQRSTNGSIYVEDVSEEEIEALYAVRAALEQMIVCQAASRMTQADLDALRQILFAQDQAAKAGNSELVLNYGEQFHRKLWKLSGNHVGIKFLGEILQRTTRYRRLSFSKPYRFRQGSRQHWKLVAALASNDLEEACELLRQHVDESRNYVVQAFRSWQRADSKRTVKPPAAFSRQPRNPARLSR